MAAISQMTFSHAFSSMKIVAFLLKFHWNVCKSPIDNNNGLALEWRQSNILTNDGLV